MSFFQNAKNWPLKPLKEVATLKRGYDLPVQERREGNVPIFAANGENGSHNAFKVKGPGVITGRSGTIGKVHYVEDSFWPLNTALYVQDFHGNDPRWVMYMLQSFRLERFVRGAGVPTLNRNLVHDELIPLPPLPEQKRIAAILDKADQLRQKRQQAITLADDFLRSVFLDMFGDPVTNPKGWSKETFEELTSAPITYGILKPEEYTPNGIPMLRIQDIRDGKVKMDNLYLVSNALSGQYKRTVLSGGEIVISLVGTVGLTAVIPSQLKGANVHRNLGVIRLNESYMTEFIAAFMQLPQFKMLLSKVSKGGVHKLLNLADLKQVEIPLPPKKLIEKFVIIRERMIAQCDYFQTSVEKQIQLFNALSQKAFAGEL